MCLAYCSLASQISHGEPAVDGHALFPNFPPFSEIFETIFPYSYPSSPGPTDIENFPIANLGRFSIPQIPTAYKPDREVVCFIIRRGSAIVNSCLFRSLLLQNLPSFQLIYGGVSMSIVSRLRQNIKVRTHPAKGRTRFRRRARLDPLTDR
jgi:hypothetical protein